MEKILADRTKCIDSSGIRKVFALAAQMKDPVNFSIGQPDFDVPEAVKKAAILAIEEGANKYSQTIGDIELIDKIAGGLKNELGWDDPKVIITSGVSGGILLAFLTLVNPGDEVIVPDPYFVMYKHLVNMLGGKCVYIDSYPYFKLPVEKIGKAVTDKTKLIIVNSPCNPTGMVYSKNEIEGVVEIARKHGIVVLSDEIYSDFSYDGRCPSVAKNYERTLLLRGFSKSHAMTGWRVGYAAVNSELREVIEKMTMIQQYTFVCSPTPFQKAAIAAMSCDMTAFVDAYKIKRDLIYDGLKDKFEMVKPDGAFYAFVKAPQGRATEFVKKAIANNLLVIPGNVFSEKDTHFRISYAASNEKIKAGIEILRQIGE